MSSYPQRVRVGKAPYGVDYLMQSHVLLRFNAQTSDRDIDRILARHKLAERSARSGPRGPNPLHAAKMRWVELSGQQLEGDAGDAAAALRGQIAEVEAAHPVYFAEGHGPESAAAPVDNVVVLEIEARQRDRALKQLASAGLKHNKRMSELLGDFDYFETTGDEEQQSGTVFDHLTRAGQVPGVVFAEADWLKLETYLLVPNDTQWANQWNMQRINLVNAWDVQTGAAGTWIAIIDSGFDLGHPDLAFTPNAGATLTHFNADAAAGGAAPPYDASSAGVSHGTAVAGLAAATLNNNTGVAGVAGGCTVMPVRLGTVPTASKVTAGVNWAAANGAAVASMSLSTTPTAAAAAAMANAWTAGLVLCAATGNGGGDAVSPPVSFPANHANVIAVGASDQNDQRKRPASADGECWGSQFGAEVDVLAPGVLCWSTDEQGANGYNNSGGAGTTWACVAYASTGDAAGDYISLFDGTSAATPHVAGLAGLLRSQYPALTNQEVRDIIERTCAKVSPALYAYANTPGRPNGTWHQEVGHGRIDCDAALRYCDVMISDHNLDDGSVPSSELVGGAWTPRAFWRYQPYVTQASNPGALPTDHEPAKAGQDNYVHAYVTNNGPATATNIQLTWHIMDYPGTELIWPTDWNAGNQIASASIGSLAAGASVAVEALWPQALVDIASAYAHPCMVVQATCAADVGGDLSPKVYDYNNIAQHNISFAGFSAAGAGTAGDADQRTFTLPFAVGHASVRRPRRATLDFDLRRLGAAEVFVDLDPADDLPYVERIREVVHKQPTQGAKGCGLTLRSDARVLIDCCGCRAEILVKAGTRARMLCGDPGGKPDLGNLTLRNAVRVQRGGRPQLLLRGPVASVELDLQAGEVLPMAMTVVAPADSVAGEVFEADVTQSTDGAADGGVSLRVEATA